MAWHYPHDLNLETISLLLSHLRVCIETASHLDAQVRQSIARTRPFTGHGVRNKLFIMDESKDLPGPGESSREDKPGWFWKPLDSHPAPAGSILGKERFGRFFGKTMEHAAHWLTSTERWGSKTECGNHIYYARSFTAGSRRTSSLHPLCELCSLSDTQTLPSLCVSSNQPLLSLSSGRASLSKTSKEVISVLWFQGASVQPVGSRSAPDLRSPRACWEAASSV